MNPEIDTYTYFFENVLYCTMEPKDWPAHKDLIDAAIRLNGGCIREIKVSEPKDELDGQIEVEIDIDFETEINEYCFGQNDDEETEAEALAVYEIGKQLEKLTSFYEFQL